MKGARSREPDDPCNRASRTRGRQRPRIAAPSPARMRREVPSAAPIASVDRKAALAARLAPRTRLLGIAPRRIAVFLLARFVAKPRLVLLFSPPSTFAFFREDVVEPVEAAFELRFELRDFPRPRRSLLTAHTPSHSPKIFPHAMIGAYHRTPNTVAKALPYSPGNASRKQRSAPLYRTNDVHLADFPRMSNKCSFQFVILHFRTFVRYKGFGKWGSHGMYAST